MPNIKAAFEPDFATFFFEKIGGSDDAKEKRSKNIFSDQEEGSIQFSLLGTNENFIRAVMVVATSINDVVSKRDWRGVLQNYINSV